MKKQRKLALRLGKVKKDQDWTFTSELTKPLLRLLLARIQDASLPATFSEEEQKALHELRTRWFALKKDPVALALRQKGVDMRIGLDIASLALKKQVGTIILVSGDGDFVPAAKLARREGIDFILDPLWQRVADDLFEHVDGMQSGFAKSPDADPAARKPKSP